MDKKYQANKLFDAIGEIDEKLLDEKKKNYSMVKSFALLAASICIVVLGIGYNIYIGNLKKPDMVAEENEYKGYFTLCKLDYNLPDYTFDQPSGKNNRYRGMEEIEGFQLPLGHADTNSFKLYCDKDGIPVWGVADFRYAERDATVFITINSKGSMISAFYSDLDEAPFKMKESTKVYGFDSGDGRLELDFVDKNGTGYTIEGYDVTCKEMIEIMDKLLNNPVDLRKLDVSKIIYDY